MTGFAVTLAPKMTGRAPPEMIGRSNLGTATYISWNVPPEMGDKCQCNLIWVAALLTLRERDECEKAEGTGKELRTNSASLSGLSY